MSEDFGVTEDGEFERKHIDEIVERLERIAEQELGDVDLNQPSPYKQIIDLFAQEQARQWEAQEENYYIGFYETTHGRALDALLALAGMTRRQRRTATGEAEFSVSDSTSGTFTIPEGTEVTTRRTDDRPPIPFKTTESRTVDANQDETVTVPIEGMEDDETSIGEQWLGEETNVESNTITLIATPISGIDSVTNPNPTGDPEYGYRRGRDRESDAEFRLRYENTRAEGGSSTVPAMESNIFDDELGIVSVTVDEVRDQDEGHYGPRVTVLAPEVEDDEIAQRVFETRAAGTESFGSESGTAVDGDDNEYTEHFERASEINVLVFADVTVRDTFPETGETRVRDNVIDYVGGEDSNEVFHTGRQIDQDVIYDQVFRHVMEVQGVLMLDLWLGMDDPTEAQEADPDETSVTDSSERGVVVESTEDGDTVAVEFRLGDHVEGATRAYLYDENENELAQTELDDEGDWFRFDEVVSFSNGDELLIGVDAVGDDYEIGLDESPAYPYDDADPVFNITERYRGDLDEDSEPTSTRPNVDAVRTNDVAEDSIEIGDREAPMTDIDSIQVVANE